MEYTNKESIYVNIWLKTGKKLEGKVNILGYPRFTDYIEKNEPTHIKLYDGKPYFKLIPVNSVDYYQPEEN